MSFKILATSNFTRQPKAPLLKKYPSLLSDLQKLKTNLSTNPQTGVPLGKDCFKIRISIASKGRGKSGGARVITYVKIVNATVYLLTIYDKSERETITSKQLQFLIELVASEF